MGYQVGSYIAYGALVELTQEQKWDWPETKPQDDRVVTFNAGEYDNNDYYLVVQGTWKGLEPGDFRIIEPYSATAEPYLSWDALIVAAAEELKVPLASQPGWIFAPDMA